MATEKKSRASKNNDDSGIMSLLLTTSVSTLKVLFKYLVSPILLSYSVLSIYWMSLLLLIKLSSVVILFVLSPRNLVDFISDYHHYKNEKVNNDSDLLNMCQGLESTNNTSISSPTGSLIPLMLPQRTYDLAAFLLCSLKRQERILAIGDRLKESLYLLEKSEYVFDRYMRQSFHYVIKNTQSSEKELYKFKGVALTRSEGFIHYIKYAKETYKPHSMPASIASNKNFIKNNQMLVVNEPTSSLSKDAHAFRVTFFERDQQICQEGTPGDTVLYLTSSDVSDKEYEQNYQNKNCQDGSFTYSRFETHEFRERPFTYGIVLEGKSKDLSSIETHKPFLSTSSPPGSGSLRTDRRSNDTRVSPPPNLSHSMKHKIECYLDRYKDPNTNKPLQVRTRGLSSSEKVKLINIELPNKEHSTLKLSITPKKPKKHRIQNENNPLLLRKVKKPLSMDGMTYHEDAKDTIKKATEV